MLTTSSFADISNWQPAATYSTIQSMIEEEVKQGLWENQDHLNGWCTIAVSPTQGMSNSWITYTYRLISDNTQTTTVIWPAGWPAPAENINGQLPGHFFSGVTTGTTGAEANTVLSANNAAPSNRPTYKIAAGCV